MQGIAKLVEAYLAKQRMDEAEKQAADFAAAKSTGEEELLSDYRKSRDAELERIKKGFMPTPSGLPRPLEEQGGGPYLAEIPKTKDELRAAFQEAQLSDYPEVRRFGETQQKYYESDEAARLAREAKAEAARIAADERLQRQREHEDFIRAITASKAPLSPYEKSYQTTMGKGAAQAEIDTDSARRGALKSLQAAGYDPVTGTDKISDLIKKSTSGTAEKYATAAMAAFGATTEGRIAINRLSSAASDITMQLLDGKLGAGISNTDREFVLQKLGDISNADKPYEERLGAWNDALDRMKKNGLMNEIAGGKPATVEKRFSDPKKQKELEELRRLNEQGLLK